MMENKNKRIINIALDYDVKQLIIEGKDKNQQVVMKEELSETDLDNVTGGEGGLGNIFRQIKCKNKN
ncbi:MAG: bacteriocin [Bacteroidaceae bacterium]|nr:bacteriocin [Bacteroidaceae bacterium]